MLGEGIEGTQEAMVRVPVVVGEGFGFVLPSSIQDAGAALKRGDRSEREDWAAFGDIEKRLPVDDEFAEELHARVFGEIGNGFLCIKNGESRQCVFFVGGGE